MAFRVVLVGCGAMSHGWLEAIQNVPYLADRVEIVGLVDVNLDHAKSLGNDYALTEAIIGSDLDAVLQKTLPDAVFDVVVPDARHQVVRTAFGRGCHVLSEKPMAADMHAARDLLDLAAAAKKTHAIVQNRRYLLNAERVREIILGKKLGDLTAIHCDFFLAPRFGGFREEMEHVLLLDMAIHTFDTARFMSGTQPVAVYCQETNPKGSWFRHGAAANAIFEMTGGVNFTYRGSWCATGRQTSWESEWRFIGTKGTLTWDGADTIAGEVKSDSKSLAKDDLFCPVTPLAVPPGDPLEAEGHAGVLVDFVKSLEMGTEPGTSGKDNIKSLAMVFAAIESSKKQQRIAIKH